MLGIGFGKLVLLILLILVIWYGFKYVNRVDEVRRTLKRARQARTRGRGAAPRIEAEDMVKCGSCGVYVAATGAAKCGRPDCPW